MSTAEWNVFGLAFNLVGLLLLFGCGMPGAGSRHTLPGWLGIILLVAGTVCQMWANIRWVG